MARLTLGLETFIYSLTSTDRTSRPRSDRIRMVSRYISPDSCKCIRSPLSQQFSLKITYHRPGEFASILPSPLVMLHTANR